MTSAPVPPAAGDSSSAVLFARMDGPLQVEIDQSSQQACLHIRAVTRCDAEQIPKRANPAGALSGTHCAFKATLWI